MRLQFKPDLLIVHNGPISKLRSHIPRVALQGCGIPWNLDRPAKITPIRVPNVAYPGIFAIVDEIGPIEGACRLQRPPSGVKEYFGTTLILLAKSPSALEGGQNPIDPG